eukprot:6417705-Amphidinium_carterae.1
MCYPVASLCGAHHVRVDEESIKATNKVGPSCIQLIMRKILTLPCTGSMGSSPECYHEKLRRNVIQPLIVGQGPITGKRCLPSMNKAIDIETE